jgi:hypothetical protein
MSSWMRAVALVVLVALAAGCFGKDPTDYAAVANEVEAHAAPFLVQDHGDERGHFDAALHNGSMNLELVGYHNGADESGDANAIPGDAYYTELAVTPNYAYLSRTSASGTYGGFVILNTRDDPAHPRKVGEFQGLGSADIEVNGNETLAFLATQRNMPAQIAGSILAAQDPRAGLPRGIYVVDIEDKTNPTLESFVPLPVNGPHTITYVAHPNGSEYLVACTYDLVTDPATGALVGTVPVTQRVIVYQIVDQPALPDPLPSLTDSLPATLVPVAQYSIPESAPAGKLFLPHDTRVQVHTTWDGGAHVLLYVAYWDQGLRILDVTDLPQLAVPPGAAPPPVQLEETGSSTDFAPSRLNNIHLAQPFDEAVAGRHVTVTQPEIQQVDGETGQLTFFDTTDPTGPQKLGRWTLPEGIDGQLGITGFDFSPHNFDLWDGKVALGHFHAGVWVVDVHDAANLQTPRTVGYYMPHVPREDSPAHQPNVWGVFEVDGLLYAVDEGTGLYVLRYTGP